MHIVPIEQVIPVPVPMIALIVFQVICLIDWLIDGKTWDRMAKMDHLDLDRALSFFQSLANSIAASFFLGVNYLLVLLYLILC